MKSSRRTGLRLPFLTVLAFATLCHGQTSDSQAPAIVRAVGVMVDKHETAVEIVCSRPIPPTITQVDNPARLVVDLPNSVMAVKRKRIDFKNDSISAIRVDQFQRSPAIVRVVVDLLKPTSYRWDTVDNRLLVHLRPDESAAAASSKPPTVPALTSSPRPVAVPVVPGATGAVVLAGNRLAAGSSVTAGSDTAVLRLGRGGEVRVCPGTTVSVTNSQNGRSLMLGMSTGALEAHYALDASADSVLTPDFRILMAGPGQFDYAISADSHGNTCVRALPGNTASVIVSELMGEGTYQVKPSEQVMFHSGQITSIDSTIPASCGCPATSPPMMRASEPSPPPSASADNLPPTVRLASPGDDVKPTPAAASAPSPDSPQNKPPAQVTLSVVPPVTAPLPESRPDDVHVAVEAPLVFRGGDPPAPQPAPTAEAQRLPVVESRVQPPLGSPVVGPPASRETPAQPEAEPAHKGFFGKLKGFFSAIFR
ncbi:MAG TPA: AMIN domain-containing protein [Terriglobales bacterium]|jgi:hypothetical protein